MTKPIPSYLRLHTEDSAEVVRPEMDELASLSDVCQAFEQATGWALRYVPGRAPAHDPDLMWSAPVDPGVGIAPGHFRIDLGGAALGERGPRLDLEPAGRLAGAIASLACTLLQTRHALWQREAELAAGVPLVATPQDGLHLAERLEASLRAAAQVVDGAAAGLYLLDAATTELKLRSCWGLPRTRLAEPPRPLKPALGDLEALSGHVVVLDNPRMFETWNVPERSFAQAVCVPVASPAVSLGTLWAFGAQARTIDDRDTQLLEIVAARVAAELERAMLLSTGAAAVQASRELETAAQFQQGQLPGVAPLVEGWAVAGRSHQADRVGGAWHDWLAPAGQELAVLVGLADDSGLAGALTATALRAAARTALERSADLPTAFERSAAALWSGSRGDRRSSLALLLVDPSLGTVRFATAGQAAVLLVREDRWERLDAPAPLLGTSPQAAPVLQERLVSPGDSLVIYALCASGLPSYSTAIDEALAAAVRAEREASSEDPAQSLLRELWGVAGDACDAALVVLSRRA